MKIRSITVFCQPGFPPNQLLLQQLGIFAGHARTLYEQAGYEVESLRLATPPFVSFLSLENLVEAALTLAIETHAEGFDYISLGPVPANRSEVLEQIPQILAQTQNVFFSAQLTTPEHEVSLPAAQAAAKLICQLAQVEPNGFANLNFCALANVPAYTPFFPAAYAQNSPPAFALALEAANLAEQTFSRAQSLQTARENLITAVETHAQKLEAIGRKLTKFYGYVFKGLDFSLAPHPAQGISIAKALEALGLPAFGLHGSLFTSAFLTDTLDQANYIRTGFNGLMLPVLEDAGLAQRASEGLLSTTDLLLCSAVCGTGLDVVPLPGDTTPEQLYPVLLDLAALALRLEKPLTARLMPIPGKAAGEATNFDFAYFANSHVLALKAQLLGGILQGNESISMAKREGNQSAN
ncbi:MAG TPA: DUF711 domain-containing protein [Anaerolineaceae bacterium]|nr:MAG: hypothetical protein XD89_0878 [Anaerolineae bacterium 49_20]HAE85165.1 DUF711 domain-containing protein [Anaerolineaceae bacterium]